MGSPFWVKARRRRRPVRPLGVVIVATDARGVFWGSMRLGLLVGVLLNNKSEREIGRGSSVCPVLPIADTSDVLGGVVG